MLAVLSGGCRNQDDSGFGARAAQIVPVEPCLPLSGTAWVPNIAGVDSSHHDATVSVTRQVVTTTGPLTGFAQPAPASQEVSVTIDMSQDLGAFGSLTLVAEPINFPSNRSGSAYPILVSLSDGTNELVHLARTGAGNDCAQSGYFLWDGSDVSVNSNCKVSAPSAYANMDQWTGHQFSPFGFASVNTFPTCNWAGGSGTALLPSCAFNSNFFVGGKLRSGVNYTAKYVLLASNYITVGSGSTAGLKVTAVKKRSNRAGVGGAIDLNVILVGQKNVQHSRTEQGKRNLDTLFGLVNDYLSQATSGIGIGAVHVYEWGCADGGEVFATASLNESTDANYVGKMLATGSSMVSASSEGKALNVFLVSKISRISENSLLEVGGLSGGLGGLPINGLAASGLAFASGEKLGSFNRLCSTTPCPLTEQDPAFYNMGSTIAHEIGHYLGLNHPSEDDGTVHDAVLDTPVCTKTEPLGNESLLTAHSCYLDDNVVLGQKCAAVCPGYDPGSGVFCETMPECQFNHLMWWFAKKFSQSLGRGDGNILSSHSGAVINYSPFVQ